MIACFQASSLSPVALRAGGSTWELLVFCMKKAFCDLWGKPAWAKKQLCLWSSCPALSSPAGAAVVISGDYFRFGVFEIKWIPCLVTVTSLFVTCRYCILQMLFFWGVYLGHCFQGETFVPGNRPLDPLPVPFCSSWKQPVGSSPACRDLGVGVGILAAEECSVSASALCVSARGSPAASGSAHHCCCSLAGVIWGPGDCTA